MDGDGRDNPVRSLLEVRKKEVVDVLVNPLYRLIREAKQLLDILVHHHETGWLTPR
jgi:hypothetical protein